MLPLPVDTTLPSPDLNGVQAGGVAVWVLVCLLLLEIKKLDAFSRLARVWRAALGQNVAPRPLALLGVWPRTAPMGLAATAEADVRVQTRTVEAVTSTRPLF